MDDIFKNFNTDREAILKYTLAEREYKKAFFISCVETDIATYQPENEEIILFRQYVDAADGDIDKLINLILTSKCDAIKMSHTYAVASKLCKDNKHWYRVRAMLDKVHKVGTDTGSLLLYSSDEKSCIHIPNGFGDCLMRFGIVDKDKFNPDMAEYFSMFVGNYKVKDEYDEWIELNGRFGAYYYEGIVILVDCTKS